MYDITKRKQFKTVGDLKELLKNIPDEAQVVVTGDDYCWFHIEEDKSVICLDIEELDDVYDGDCPLGGDITDDCADCAYSCDYHYENGECVRRGGYIPSAENGDYSPNNPWDAPRMSVKDFI